MCDHDSLPLASPAPCPCSGKCRSRKDSAGGEAEGPRAVVPSLTEGQRQFDSGELFDGTRSIAIRHAGETYRLMVTRNDRLILQK